MHPWARMVWLGAASTAMAICQSQPMLPENAVTRVSAHAYAIQGWPNIGKLYLTTTHFHPERASGEVPFPAGTILIRPAVQEEMEARLIRLVPSLPNAGSSVKGWIAATELKAEYPDWQNPGPVANVVRHVYAESQ